MTNDQIPKPQGMTKLRARMVFAVVCVGSGLSALCLWAMALVGGCGRAPEANLETAALSALLTEFKLEYHEKDEKGRVIDLRLEGPQFDDKALAHVARFPELEGLSLARSAVTDAGLEKLPVLKNLERITLIGTKVTNRGLKALGKMPSLQQVWLDESKQLTSSGIAALQAMLPGVNVHVMNRPDKN